MSAKCQSATLTRYSITSSANATKLTGSSMPVALAVLKLTTNVARRLLERQVSWARILEKAGHQVGGRRAIWRLPVMSATGFSRSIW